jgi:hypothetical protein
MSIRKDRRSGTASAKPPTRTVQVAWLPGTVEVHVVGETFHADAIGAVQCGARADSDLTAVLVPEPGNPHDGNAVAVYLEGRQVGHLAASLAVQVQPALLAFAAAHEGQVVGCIGRIYRQGAQPNVVLFLDPGPLGLAPGIFDHVPELDRVIAQMITRLDLPVPPAAGHDHTARQALAVTWALADEVDADYERSPQAWPQVERAFREVARCLEEAGDPLASDAWAGIARSVRYQKGRRDDRIAAAVTALYWNRSNTGAWAELFDLASAAPHVPTLLELFRRVPADVRSSQIGALISLSRGHDRLGNMRPESGEELRAGLTAIAEADHDTPSLRKLANDARKHASTTRRS